MHDTALEYGKHFFETYTKFNQNSTIVDIGAQDVNGSLREVALHGNKYIGVVLLGVGGSILLLMTHTIFRLKTSRLM